MRTRIGLLIAGALLVTLAGMYAAKTKFEAKTEVICKERTSDKNEKKIRSSSVPPIWENLTRHLIRM
jgi:hypothetical protein